MNKFGAISRQRLEQGHTDLFKIFILAIQRSSIDFSIIEVERAMEKQLEYFQNGLSGLDPRNEDDLASAKHLITELRQKAEAADIAIYHPDPKIKTKLAYDIPSLSYVAGIIQSCAIELYNKGDVTHIIRWGGNWDKDGIIIQDQKFDDLVHFELVKP